MGATEVLGFLLTLLVMIIGLLGAVLPAIPGTPLIFAAALGHQLWFRSDSVGWWVIVGLGLITAFSMVLDFVATTYGAKRLGATWRGMLGAGLGALVGVFVFPPFGLVLFPLVGAAAGEMLGGRPWRDAGKAGMGATLGIIAGTLGKIGCSLAMIGLWVFKLLWGQMVEAG